VSVRVVVPEGFDDPHRPSGGNAYDRAVVDGLAAASRLVTVHPVAGAWPRPSARDLAGLRAVLAGLPDGSAVLVDGLVASASALVLVPEARRLRVVVLLHLALGGHDEPLVTEAERQVLTAASAVVTTSEWSRGHVVDLHGLPAGKVRVARPGVVAAPLARATPQGRRLLCVATLVPAKGHDVLLTALARVADLDWELVCVGSRQRDPAYAADLVGLTQKLGLQQRVRFVGVRAGAELAATYAASDLHVLATRLESYGMVLTESLARGVPVIATAVGGVPEAVGHVADGERPGGLVPPDDPVALGDAVRRWLEEPRLRATLRARALERRTTLPGWEVTTAEIDAVLDGPPGWVAA
jgi:glycosyltransferase involved in cell wall biosynthesis